VRARRLVLKVVCTGRMSWGATISLADGSVEGFLLEHSAVFALDFQPGPAGSRISYVS
jgi:hypothetical protein